MSYGLAQHDERARSSMSLGKGPDEGTDEAEVLAHSSADGSWSALPANNIMRMDSAGSGVLLET